MTHDESRRTFWGALRNTFGRGVVVLVPVVITIWVLNLVFTAVDGIISPLFDHLLSRHIPGLGFISMIILILAVGILSRNLFGRSLFKFFERIITSIPLARTIYSAIKDLVGALQAGGKGKSFRRVVIIEYPRAGSYTVGFVTNELSIRRETATEELVSVYIPNPPNPTSGIMILLPREQVRSLDISVEDGLKLVLSGGIVTSGNLSIK